MRGLPPKITSLSRPYWEALKREEVLLPHCTSCKRFFFYPRNFCPHCASRDWSWLPAAQRAVLYAWSIAEVPVSSAFSHLMRPVLGVAQLHGVHIPTSIVDTDADSIAIGMALEPVFDHDTYPQVTLLRFRGC